MLLLLVSAASTAMTGPDIALVVSICDKGYDVWVK